MAHFAQINDSGIVTRVIVVNNSELHDDDGLEVEAKGINFCRALFGGSWLQTSYSGKIRGVFAGIGYRYDTAADKFIAPTLEPTVKISGNVTL
jgi:hypothetical protein